MYKRAILGVLAIGLAGASVADDWLVKDGQAAASIVLPPGSSPSEERAAAELQEHFALCTGASLPIVEQAPGDAPAIVLGLEAAAELGVKPSPAALGEQGYVLRTVGPRLVIAGTRAAGTLYGAYDVLERVLGVRWYAPGVAKTPHCTSVSVPQLDEIVTPGFLWRKTSYEWPGADEAFWARQRCNSGGGGPDHPFGVQYSFDGRAHSYFWYINRGAFAEHPEYFSEIGGVRRDGETQLCLTNPEVLDIVTERMLERMASKPGCRQHNFSQMDWYSYCECPKCAAMNDKYGTRGGTQFWFVNQLAERTAKVYPDKLIGTLAYTYTEKPPKGLEMHPNVAVWLCHMFPSCDSHPIATCEHDANYKRRAEAWSKICKHLYVWHYCVDFAHYYNPFPNLRAMAADMRFYRDIGVEGVYLQAMGHGGGGGEFSLLRPYYGMKLLWNPDCDADAVIQDFLGGYYGAAAEPIWQYITMLHDKVENEDIHMHLYTNPAQGYLTDEVLERAKALFDEAEARVAGDPELLERVKVARMPLTYAAFFPRNGYTLENGFLTFNPPIASPNEVGAFIRRMQDHGFQTVREVAGDLEFLAMMAVAFHMPMAAPRLSNAQVDVDVVPWLGGRTLRFTDRAADDGPYGYNIKRNLLFPFCGGETTRLGSYFRPYGFYAQYEVAEQSQRELVLVAEQQAFRIERRLELAADAPELVTTVTVTNITDKPQEALVRTHMNLDLGALEQTRFSFVNRKGETVQRAMPSIIANYREGEHFHDENVPGGAWSFTGSKGLRFTQRFDDAQVDYTWVYAYPAYINDLEAEIWLKPTVLEPGAALTFSHVTTVERMGAE